jgi:hypothetical protein
MVAGSGGPSLAAPVWRPLAALLPFRWAKTANRPGSKGGCPWVGQMQRPRASKSGRHARLPGSTPNFDRRASRHPLPTCRAARVVPGSGRNRRLPTDGRAPKSYVPTGWARIHRNGSSYPICRRIRAERTNALEARDVGPQVPPPQRGMGGTIRRRGWEQASEWLRRATNLCGGRSRRAGRARSGPRRSSAPRAARSRSRRPTPAGASRTTR